jgi:hypothetical protein
MYTISVSFVETNMRTKQGILDNIRIFKEQLDRPGSEIVKRWYFPFIYKDNLSGSLCNNAS